MLRVWWNMEIWIFALTLERLTSLQIPGKGSAWDKTLIVWPLLLLRGQVHNVCHLKDLTCVWRK